MSLLWLYLQAVYICPTVFLFGGDRKESKEGNVASVR